MCAKEKSDEMSVLNPYPWYPGIERFNFKLAFKSIEPLTNSAPLNCSSILINLAYRIL